MKAMDVIEKRTAWVIEQGKCEFVMIDMPGESVDLVIADPPFGIGHKYDQHDDDMSLAQYVLFTKLWMKTAIPNLKPNGSMWVMIGDERVAEVKTVGQSLDLSLRNWCIWHYNFGPHQQKKFGRDKCHLLYFVNDPKHFTFNADAIRVPSLRQTKYQDKRANPKGRVPGDVWEFPRICGTFKKRTGHPAQMPEEITDRIVLACSNPGDLVLDPFAGSGSTIVSAVKHGRRAIGIELSEAYAEAARQRVAKVLS